jgi:outer membrane immunogenic protein
MGDETMNFKLFGTGLAALTLLASSFSAQAADMPRPIYKGEMRSMVGYFNWSGLYVGVNGGYGFGTSTWELVPGTDVKPKGFLAGGTVGYNWQTGAIVYGLEGDFDWADVKGSIACVPGVVSCETTNNWLATFRGRIGFAFDRWLPYLTGGGAYGRVKATTAPIGGVAASVSGDQLGWTIGGGVEYAFMSNWSAKVEYLYVDLGRFDTGVAPVVNNVSFTENIVRAGVNYKFFGPIASRY